MRALDEMIEELVAPNLQQRWVGCGVVATITPDDEFFHQLGQAVINHSRGKQLRPLRRPRRERGVP
ncbi:MAG: hypothetical protein OXT09_35435 [Myxococcales bacterium]|nr:hypothetical protein [Myxococcales bacterium]